MKKFKKKIPSNYANVRKHCLFRSKRNYFDQGSNGYREGFVFAFCSKIGDSYGRICYRSNDRPAMSEQFEFVNEDLVSRRFHSYLEEMNIQDAFEQIFDDLINEDLSEAETDYVVHE